MNGNCLEIGMELGLNLFHVIKFLSLFIENFIFKESYF